MEKLLTFKKVGSCYNISWSIIILIISNDHLIIIAHLEALWVITYSLSLDASVNLFDRVWQSNTPIKRGFLSAIKQCPAASVVPVLTPDHPSLSRSLLVFFQTLLLDSPYLSFFILTSYYRVLITSTKV